MPIEDQRRIADRVLRALGIKLDRRALADMDPAAGSNLLETLPDKLLSVAVGSGSRIEVGPNVAVWTHWPLSHFDLTPPSVYLQIGRQQSCTLTGFFSSRLGRSLEKQVTWFAALRTACVRMSPPDAVLAANDQTAFRFLRRLADSIPFDLIVLVQTTTAKLSQCLRHVLSQQSRPTSDRLTWMVRVVVSTEQIVPDDAAVAELCHELRVLFVRRRGNIERLIDDQLQRPESKRILIRTLPDRQSPIHVQRLMNRGALAWHVFDSARTAKRGFRRPSNDSRPLLRVCDIDPTRYLSHFTRRQSGPWSDETEEHYLDALLFGLAPADRGAGMTLLRILLQRHLIADNRMTRDKSRVVCFTNRSLSEFASLRKFRSHLARWDFEPYGIAIDRKLLTRMGARPVVYADESAWQTMAPADRPFFQLSKPGHADWSGEQEWRIVGDLDLESLGPGDAVVFVPSEDEARKLSPFSRWPAVVLAE